MTELDECRVALAKQIRLTKQAETVGTIRRAALIEACGGNHVKAGLLYQKHDERIARIREGGND